MVAAFNRFWSADFGMPISMFCIPMSAVKMLQFFVCRNSLYKQNSAYGPMGRPWKINGWNLKMEVWKMICLFKGVIFR